MPIEIEENDKKIAKQEARAKLRESFLRAVNQLYGEPCNILTYEQSILQANFCGWNIEGSEVLVHNLKTPAHVQMSSAVLRTPDILAIQFDRPVNI